VSQLVGVAEEGGSDGVVPVASAKLDNVDSQIVVPADHSSVHRHPLSVLELQRILLLHLAEIDRPQRLPVERPREGIEVRAPSVGVWSR
jgi:hypothetical protein